MEVKVKKLNERARIPTRGSDGAAGYDLYALCEHRGIEFVQPYKKETIHTGISMSIPKGYFGAVFARSGLALKEGLRPANCVGVIDSDYRGEIMIAMYNDSDQRRIIEDGERVAQIVILPCSEVEFEEADHLDETDRGGGGFGSTGKNEQCHFDDMTVEEFIEGVFPIFVDIITGK